MLGGLLLYGLAALGMIGKAGMAVGAGFVWSLPVLPCGAGKSVIRLEKFIGKYSVEEVDMVMEAKPVSKIDIYQRGMRGLHKILGDVDAEEFIVMVKSENLDYTEWRRQYFDQMTPEQFLKEAEEYEAAHPYKGNPATVI